jgi:adenosylcobinamide-phosphate synthase
MQPRSGRSASSALARAVGLALGVALDAGLGDPRRGHPVAGFGRLAQALEARWYGDSRRDGARFAVALVAGAAATGALLERGTPVLARRLSGRRVGWLTATSVTAVSTWAVLGSRTLGREGRALAVLLDSDDLPAARHRLRNLCARDASQLSADDLARAGVESLAENANDAVVAPLLWGAVAGVPGLLAYRAVNTLDAMVGYRSPRYRRFGWASARLDDLANLVPARVTGLLVAAVAGGVGGSGWAALRVLVREGHRHPSPNAGYPEAATAGALGVRLGGTNRYHGSDERRPELGAGGRAVQVDDLHRAVGLLQLTTVAATGSAVLTVLAVAARRSVAGRLPAGPRSAGRTSFGRGCGAAR